MFAIGAAAAGLGYIIWRSLREESKPRGTDVSIIWGPPRLIPLTCGTNPSASVSWDDNGLCFSYETSMGGSFFVDSHVISDHIANLPELQRLSTERMEGSSPYVAVYKDIVATVFTTVTFPKICFRLGRNSQEGIEWFTTVAKGKDVGRGKQPAIAVFHNTIVEVHQGLIFDRIWYTVGQIQGVSNRPGVTPSCEINWNSNNLLFEQSSFCPTIAINSQYCLALAVTTNNRTVLSYRVGTLTTDRTAVNWGTQKIIYNSDRAVQHLSMTMNAFNKVVIGYSNNRGQLCVLVAQINTDLDTRLLQLYHVALTNRGSVLSCSISDDCRLLVVFNGHGTEAHRRQMQWMLGRVFIPGEERRLLAAPPATTTSTSTSSSSSSASSSSGSSSSNSNSSSSIVRVGIPAHNAQGSPVAPIATPPNPTSGIFKPALQGTSSNSLVRKPSTQAESPVPSTSATTATSSSSSVPRPQSNSSVSSSSNNNNIEDNEDMMCVVCLEAPKSVLCYPCGHMCLCSQCAGRKYQTCPVCRVPVEKLVRVYM